VLSRILTDTRHATQPRVRFEIQEEIYMSDTYKITIESIDENKVIAIIQLINFQMPDVPINKCLGLQILADAYLYLTEYRQYINISIEKALLLSSQADPTIIKFSKQLAERHNTEFTNELISIAEEEITSIVELLSYNFDKIEGWNETINQGKEVLPFEELNVAQKILFSVSDGSLLKHIAPELTWRTAMYVRDETY
jgi:hypothetical protein